MRWVEKLRMRMQMLFRRRDAGAELDYELRDHLERQIAENMVAGMSAKEARLAALREFGNPALLREQARATWSWNWLELIARDVRYGVRTLRRARGFSLVAVAVMALCIGAATSLFTIVRSVLLRPLPFRAPNRLVMVYEHFRDPSFNAQGFNYNGVAPADYRDWRAETHGFEDLAAWRYAQINLTGEGGELPELVEARGGTWNLFPLLGVQPVLGRSFTAAEDQPGGAAFLLSWSLFERRFGGDPSIVGRQVHLDGKPCTVVGVLPKWFIYPDAKVQIWVPFSAGTPPEILEHHDYHFARVVARLRPDVSLANALSQVGAVQYRLHMQNLHAPVAEDVAPRILIEDLAQDVKKPLEILMCAVACLLLIGCLNVANLLVARGAARQKEVAIRGALGAGRLTLIREQLTESLLLCVGGGVTGILLSLAATKWLTFAWKDLPSAEGIHVDVTVLGFACALVILSALLSGLLPAISSTTKTVFALLQPSARGAAGSQSRTALRKTLLTVEIAATVILLIAAGLLLKSFWRWRATNLGCAVDNVLTMGYSLPAQKYDTPAKVDAFNESLLSRVSGLPGVRAAAIGTVIPGQGTRDDAIFTVPEHPPTAPGAPLPDALFRMVSPDYFNTLQIPLLRGRFFTSQDRAGRRRTVIVSNVLARQYFPGEIVLGKHLHLVPYGNADYEVVGVVGDTLHQVGQPAMAVMYFPVLNGDETRGMTLVVRTASDPLAISVPIQKQIAEIDPGMPVSDVQTTEQIIGDSLGNQSLISTLVLAFAVLSLLLASVGLYGVLAYLVSQRTGEIGIRIAMGAKREQVLRLMLMDGLQPALVGLGLGLAGSTGIGQFIRSMLYGTEVLDPVVFSAVAATLLLVAAIACVAPAWRASRLNPVVALREQ